MLRCVSANCAGQLTRTWLVPVRLPSTANDFLKIVMSVEALALPALVHGGSGLERRSVGF